MAAAESPLVFLSAAEGKKIIFAICFKGLQTIPKLGRGTGLESKLLGVWGTFFGCFVLLLSN